MPDPLDTLTTLKERFSRYVHNSALTRYRNRALPNVGVPTNEEDVHEFMQNDDEQAFVQDYRDRLSENNDNNDG